MAISKTFAWTLVVVIVIAEPCHASIGASIASSIGNGIKNFFINAAKFIINTAKNLITWILNLIRTFIENLVRNVSASFSLANQIISGKANETLSDIVDVGNPNMKELFLSIMYTGPLPDSYYTRPVDLAGEKTHLVNLIWWAKLVAIAVAAFIGIMLIPLFIILVWYCNLKVQVRRLEEQEKLFVKQVKKRKERQVKDKQKEEEMKENLAGQFRQQAY